MERLLDIGAERVHALVDSLTVPRPWDLRQLLDTVAGTRGRPIILLARTGLACANHPCGIWLERDNDDIIVYDDQTSNYHVEQIVLHELGHILLDHGAGGTSGKPETQFELMVPDIDPATVRRVLGRSIYDDESESQAELFASLVLSKAKKGLSATRFYTTFFRDAD